MRTALVATVFVLAAGAALLAQSPSVHDLIEQLGHEDYEKREAASEALRKVSPRALPQLRLARSQHPDAEVRDRLNKLIPVLSRASDLREILASPLIRLRFEEESLTEVLWRTQQETGILFTMPTLSPERRRKRITLDTGDVLPWEAFYQVMQAAGLEPGDAPCGDEDRALKDLGRSFGPYFFVPLQVPPMKIVECRGPVIRSHLGLVCVTTSGIARAGAGYRLPLTIAVEPRVTIHELGMVVLETVRPDAGAVLITGQFQGARNNFREWTVRQSRRFPRPNEAIWRQRLEVGILPQGPPARVLKLVQGIAHLRLVTPSRDLARFSLSPGREVTATRSTRDGGNLRFLHLAADLEGSWSMEIEATHPVRGAWAEPGGGNLDERDLNSPFSMFDRTGNPIPMLAGSFQARDETRCTYRLRFAGTPEQYGPVELLYTGRRHVRLEVPFEFRDLPLP
jgi:hypothetical protein